MGIFGFLLREAYSVK